MSLLDTTSNNTVPRFNAKNGYKFIINLKNIYNTNKEIRFKTSMQRSDLCDYVDAYIAVERTITVADPNDR